MSYLHKYLKYKTKYYKLLTGGNILEPKISLIRDHGTDGSFSEWKKKMNIDQDQAFCLKFVSNSKTLFYIGAKHTTDPQSSTYAYINMVINKYKPNIVIVEGIPYAKGISPKLSPFQGEVNYAIEEANKNNIPYSGIECSENENLLTLAKKYKIDDIYGFIYLRMHKYFYSTMKLSEEEFNKSFEKYEIPRLNNLFGKVTWNPNEWFEKKFNEKFKYGNFLEYAAPYNTEIITQQISSDYSKIRSECNIVNLYKFINQYHSVLYIMGENHVHADLNILIDTFGSYEIINLV